MSFLTHKPNFSGTIYANADQYLQEVRDLLVAMIRVTAPEWLDNPKGVLGELWSKDDVYASCYLIWIACMLRDISKNIDQESQIRLQAKFKALLYASEPK